MAKTLKKKASKKPASVADADKDGVVDGPVETLLTDFHSGNVLRCFDLGALFGVEALTGTIHLIPKDRVSNQFRRTGTNIAYADRGFDPAPKDPKSYVTIEEVEELCTEITDDNREQAKSALDENLNKEGGSALPSTRLGELLPPDRSNQE